MWFLFRAKRPDENALLNVALGMAMEFGKNWLQPIQERLRRKFKGISELEAIRLNGRCREIMAASEEWVRSSAENNPGIKLNKKEYSEFMLGKYPEINEKNLSHPYSQACYYAWKDGHQFQ